MGEITISCNTGEVSDGYHTFNELYEHRYALFAALMKSNPALSWRAKSHADGTGLENWFIAGMHLPTGDITYHLPISMWEMLDKKGIATSNKAPEWDGHTSRMALARIGKWVEGRE